jgi:hypothetical protein
MPSSFYQLAIDCRGPRKNRLHIELDPDDQAAEVARLLALGARHADVGQGGGVPWVVLADLEGNEFCVLRPHRSLID